MSMLYDPKRGWIEIQKSTRLVNEDLERQNFETKRNIEEMKRHIQNVQGYVNYCIEQYEQNPENQTAIDNIKGLTEYLRKNIGPGMIGDWHHAA